MAKDKKSFILHCDLLHTVEALTDAEAGELFKTILRYVNDKDPVCEDRIIKIAFEPIKQQLKRDLFRWDEALLKKSDGGVLGNIKRWHPDLYDKIMNKEITLHKANEIINDRMASDTDTKDRIPSDTIASVAVSVNVSDSVSVSDNVIESSKQIVKRFTPPTIEELSEIITDRFEAEKYLDYYNSNGWIVGRSKMKDWKAAARNWLRNKKKFNPEKPAPPKRDFDEEFKKYGHIKMKDL